MIAHGMEVPQAHPAQTHDRELTAVFPPSPAQIPTAAQMWPPSPTKEKEDAEPEEVPQVVELAGFLLDFYPDELRRILDSGSSELPLVVECVRFTTLRFLFFR